MSKIIEECKEMGLLGQLPNPDEIKERIEEVLKTFLKEFEDHFPDRFCEESDIKCYLYMRLYEKFKQEINSHPLRIYTEFNNGSKEHSREHIDVCIIHEKDRKGLEDSDIIAGIELTTHQADINRLVKKFKAERKKLCREKVRYRYIILLQWPEYCGDWTEEEGNYKFRNLFDKTGGRNKIFPHKIKLDILKKIVEGFDVTFIFKFPATLDPRIKEDETWDKDWNALILSKQKKQ
ncbi:MAG: hypothetical protein ABIB71_04010 [Candidatus Woesearchaeota archaeon]